VDDPSDPYAELIDRVLRDLCDVDDALLAEGAIGILGLRHGQAVLHEMEPHGSRR
jgi:hypothetical protein